MPIYEYSCGKCGHGMEILIRTDSDIPTKCSKCGSTRVKKAFSAFAVTSSAPAGACESCPTAGTGCPGAGKSSCGLPR
jgi:putative FmdB family regulatory protein